MILNYSLSELTDVAQKVIKNSKNNVLLFYGEMGVGKTTLIKEIVKQLGVNDNVSSPTFSLVNEYHSTDGSKIFHFDFYRINNEDEALDMGIEEYFYSKNWCLVEWPNKVENLVPLNAVNIKIKVTKKDLRTLELKNNE
jgi:tRNA threonylcarbamoyladenosine biosynthesis protein TsaE